MIFNPKFSDFNANFGCEPTIDCCWGKLYVITEILHHSQLAFYEQALRPVPQENLSFVEQAEEPVADMAQDVSCQERRAM